MANLRVRDFVDTLTPAQKADITGVFTWVDKAGWTAAQKLELASLLSDSIVANNSIDYKALTPKGFYDSIATETRRGVSELASDLEITDKTSTNIISASKQGVMQTKWKEDWFTFNGVVPTLHQNAAESSIASMVYSFAWEGILVAGGSTVITPTLPSGKEIESAYITSVVRVGVGLTTGTSIYLENRGLAYEAVLGGLSMYIGAPADGGYLYLKNGYAETYPVALAATIHLVMKGA